MRRVFIICATIAAFSSCKSRTASQAKNVIGQDDRLNVIDPSAYPYSAIAEVTVRFDHGVGKKCTGFFVRPRILLTSGNCVYDHQYQVGWARSAEIRTALCGTVVSDKFYSVSNWVNGAELSVGLGAIVMPTEDCGRKSGWLAVGDYSDDQLRSSAANVAAFDPIRGMVRHSGFLVPINATLFHNIDTAPGSDGAPLFFWFPEKGKNSAVAVGMHIGTGPMPPYGDETNRAIRFSGDFFEIIKDWRDRYATEEPTECLKNAIFYCPPGSIDGCTVPGLTNRNICVDNRNASGNGHENVSCNQATALLCNDNFVDACKLGPSVSDKHICVLAKPAQNP